MTARTCRWFRAEPTSIVARSNQELIDACARGDYGGVFPHRERAALRRAVVVREKRATFSLAPGQPARPGTRTPVPGLFLAGDWIDTGLPATIESAVVSGHRAAEAVCQSDEFHRRPLSGDCAQGKESSLVPCPPRSQPSQRRVGPRRRSVRALMGRIEIVLGPGARVEAVGDRIRRTFGIANFSYAGRTALDLDASSSARSLRDLRDRECGSFRVSARRADKRFPLDLAADRAGDRRPHQDRRAGGTSTSRTPSSWFTSSCSPDQAFYFFGKERGPGGLPTGTAGRVACLLSGGIDSPVAAHRMMKRGCVVTFVHFHSYPILSRASQEKVAGAGAAPDTLAASLAAVSRGLWRDSAAGGSWCAGSDAGGRSTGD